MNYGLIHFLFIFVFVLIYIHHLIPNHHRSIILVKPFISIDLPPIKRYFLLGSLLRELTTHFSALAVHNRKNLFVYCGELNDYYMRFREDIHPPSTPGLMDDSLLLSESNAFNEPPSPQINTMKNRQRHDSVKRRDFNENFDLRFVFRELLLFM